MDTNGDRAPASGNSNEFQPEIQLICWVLAGLLLVGAFAEPPYAFYQFLRLAVTVGAAFLCFTWARSGLWVAAIPAAALVIAYNPIFPLEMEREEWVTVNVASAALLVAMPIALFREIRFGGYQWKLTAQRLWAGAGIVALAIVILSVATIRPSPDQAYGITNTTEVVPLEDVVVNDAMLISPLGGEVSNPRPLPSLEGLLANAADAEVTAAERAKEPSSNATIDKIDADWIDRMAGQKTRPPVPVKTDEPVEDASEGADDALMQNAL